MSSCMRRMVAGRPGNICLCDTDFIGMFRNDYFSIKKMDRITIISIILIIMLFTGIAIMMDPTKLTGFSQFRGGIPTVSNNQNLRAVLTLGSVSTIVGLVGIGVIGFISSKKAHEN